MSALSEERACLAAIEAKISDIEAVLSGLQAERAQVEAVLDAFKFPVLSLPNEIISETFIQTLPPYPDAPPLFGLESPRKLLAICSKWNDIALSTPALWRAIWITTERRDWDNDGDLEHVAHAVDTWLSLSGAFPLAIHLDLDQDQDTAQSAEKLVLALLAYRFRWEVLELDIPLRFLPLVSGNAPQLKELCLTRWFEGSVNEPAHSESLGPGPSVSFGETPCLRSLELVELPFSIHSVSWTVLTDLDLYETSMSDCAPVLQEATNLVCCRLTLVVSHPSRPRNLSSRIFLPFLDTLVIQRCGLGHEVDEPDGLAHFTLPALRRICLPAAFVHSDLIGNIHAFVEHSNCMLQVLLVTPPWTSVRQGGALRKAFPSIPQVATTWAKIHRGVYAKRSNFSWKSDSWWTAR